MISFVSAVVLAYICIYIPPEGIIDTSVLWFTAQLLLFAASILGIDYHVFNSNKNIQPN